MVEYQRKASSGVAKAGLATAAATAGLVLLGGGGLPNLGGILPTRGAYGAPVAFAGGHYDGGYVTDKDMNLIREIGSKDSTIARLEAEKYTDAVVAAATIPLANRVCELETAAAVNAARDHDFRRYVEREFVHQPKASMRESIVVCQQCGCHQCECGCH